MGRTSAGKRIFLIRFPPVMRTVDDSRTEELNHVQGRIPVNRNSVYGDIPTTSRPVGRMCVKTNQ